MAEVPPRVSAVRLRPMACGRGSLERAGSWEPHSLDLLSPTETGFSPRTLILPQSFRGALSHTLPIGRGVGSISSLLEGFGLPGPLPQGEGTDL